MPIECDGVCRAAQTSLLTAIGQVNIISVVFSNPVMATKPLCTFFWPRSGHERKKLLADLGSLPSCREQRLAGTGCLVIAYVCPLFLTGTSIDRHMQ